MEGAHRTDRGVIPPNLHLGEKDVRNRRHPGPLEAAAGLSSGRAALVVVLRLLQRYDRDRLQNDRASLDLDLEQGLFVQTEGSPDVGRQGHPPGRVHGNDASHAPRIIPDEVHFSQIDCLTSCQGGRYAGGAMRRSLKLNGAYGCTVEMSAVSAHQVPTPARGQARSVFV